jgi:hypothetical protein
MLTNQFEPEIITPIETKQKAFNQPTCIIDLICEPTGYFEYFYLYNYLKYKYVGYFNKGLFEGQGSLYRDSEDGYGFVIFQEGVFSNGCLIVGKMYNDNKIYTGNFSTRQEDKLRVKDERCMFTALYDVHGKIQFLNEDKSTFEGRVIMGDMVRDEGEFSLPRDQKAIDEFDIGSIPFILGSISNSRYIHTFDLKDTYKKDLYCYSTDVYSYLGNMQYYMLNGIGRVSVYNGDYEEGLFLNSILVKGVSKCGNLISTGTFKNNGTLDDGKVEVKDTSSKEVESTFTKAELNQNNTPSTGIMNTETIPKPTPTYTFKFVIPDNYTLKDIMNWDSSTFKCYLHSNFPNFPQHFFTNMSNKNLTTEDIHQLTKQNYLDMGLSILEYQYMKLNLEQLISKYI